MRRLILLALLLSACGTASESPILNLARAKLEENRQGAVRPGLEQQKAAIANFVRGSGSSDPVLMVTLPKRGAVASLVVGGVNGGAVTWLDSTGVSVVTRRGVVIATRGLGEDVMASDVSGTLAALDRSKANYVRVQRFLDGEGHLQDIRLTCDAAHAGTRMTENCRGEGVTLSNSYEMQRGSVAKSRQWLGQAVGYAEIVRLQ